MASESFIGASFVLKGNDLVSPKLSSADTDEVIGVDTPSFLTERPRDMLCSICNLKPLLLLAGGNFGVVAVS
jgi:hypothetical protein